MNKYLGKPSQKLCIAGFVACALAAPLFQLDAVQDFVLNDVARALIGRSLLRFDHWRNFVKAFSGLLVAVAFVAFGFLYSVATFPRVSGYFKGAGDELKSFFHNKDVFNKRNGCILLAIFGITFIGFFALIRSGAGYMDDIARQVTGNFGWLPGLGRIVTEVINLAIHGTYLIHDRSPLGQVIAMGFLSVAALIMALVFSGFSGGREGKRLKWLNVAAAMIVVFSPYFLQGIAYKYDCVGMGMSILFPLIPFLFVHAPRLYTVASFVCALGVYMSYQASTGIYIMMVIFVALLKYVTEEWSLGETARFCAKSALSFIAASALFLLLVRFLSASGQHLSTDVSIGANVPRNIALCLFAVWRDFNGLWKALSILVTLAAAFAVCRLSKKKLQVALPLFTVALALALVLSQGSYIFLADYYGAARGRYGFGVLLAILASISVLSAPSLSALWKKAVATAPTVALAWSFFSYASAFGNAHANQSKMLNQYMDLVRQDINELFTSEERPEISITFAGSPPWSGEVINLVKKYPITASLVEHFYLTYYFLPFEPSIMNTSVVVGGKEKPFLMPVGETTILLSRRYYDILLEEGTGRIIVECKMNSELRTKI